MEKQGPWSQPFTAIFIDTPRLTISFSNKVNLIRKLVESCNQELDIEIYLVAACYTPSYTCKAGIELSCSVHT